MQSIKCSSFRRIDFDSQRAQLTQRQSGTCTALLARHRQQGVMGVRRGLRCARAGGSARAAQVLGGLRSLDKARLDFVCGV
jgi:hypothetical protein